MVPHRRTGLINLTLAHKYEQHLPKCVGVSIADDEAGWSLILDAAILLAAYGLQP